MRLRGRGAAQDPSRPGAPPGVGWGRVVVEPCYRSSIYNLTSMRTAPRRSNREQYPPRTNKWLSVVPMADPRHLVNTSHPMAVVCIPRVGLVWQ